MWHCCVSDSCCVQRIKKLENIERVTEPGPRSIKADPPATGRKPAALTPWAQLDAVYQDNLIRAIILPALRRILACVGDRRSMDMVMGKLQASHSLHQRAQSVTDAECLFDDAVRIAERSGASTIIEAAVRGMVKDSLSPYELMIMLDAKGVSQSVRRAIQNAYGVLHSEDVVLDEKKLEATMADQIVGKPIEVFDEKGKRLGFMSDTKRCVTQLAIRALVPELQPQDADSVDFDELEDTERSRLESVLSKSRTSGYTIKVEAQLRNLPVKMTAAKRRCQVNHSYMAIYTLPRTCICTNCCCYCLLLPLPAAATVAAVIAVVRCPLLLALK